MNSYRYLIFVFAVCLLTTQVTTTLAQDIPDSSVESEVQEDSDSPDSSSTESDAPAIPSAPGLSADFLANSFLQDRNNNGLLDIVAFGDSITRGVGDMEAAGSEVFQVMPVEAGEAGYPLRIELLLGIPVSNLGDPGEKLSIAGLKRFSQEIPKRKPDIVFIEGGSNDAFRSVSAQDYFRSVQTMINIAQASGTLPILITTPPSCCNHAGIGFFTDAYNKELKSLAQINEIPLADAHKGFSNTCSSPECFLLNLPEGLHPNIRGYDIMGEVAIASLLNIDIFDPIGPSTLEIALNLPPGSIETIADAPLETMDSSELTN